MTVSPSVTGVLVAIPTLNEAPRIAAVLAQLDQGLPSHCAVRFLVLDGGSTDGTQSIVSQLAVRDSRIALVHNSAKIQSAAINLAARLALPGETYLIRADAHTAYPPGFVASVVDALAHSGAEAVVVPMDSLGTTCFGRATAWVSDTKIGSGGSAHRGGQLSMFVDHGHHAGWHLDAFRKVGGYNETYSHNEDAELDCRINRLSMRVWLDAEIRLTYFVRPTPSALFKQYRNYGRGRSRTVRRHPGSMRPRQLAVPTAMLSIFACLVLGVVLTPWAFVVPGIYFSALIATSAQVALRQRSACGLLAGLAAFTMHFAWTIGFLGGLLAIREPVWSHDSKVQ